MATLQEEADDFLEKQLVIAEAYRDQLREDGHNV